MRKLVDRWTRIRFRPYLFVIMRDGSPQAFWDLEADAPTHQSWMAHPLVRDYINRSIDDAGGWPFDWFVAHYPQRFRRALSIGCGTGALERDLIRREMVERVDAFDASPRSLEIAREEAAKLGMSERIHYFQDDFNRVRLPSRRYDIVFFHQSLHHVDRLERLLLQVARTLVPGGLLYLDEFVGPSRTYWTERRCAAYRAMYQFVPRQSRWFDELPVPIQYEDLSEAVRSGEIVPLLRWGFEVEQFRGYGGNLLAVLYPCVDPRTLSEEMIRSMIAGERSMIDVGVDSFHAVVVARPVGGVRSWIAALRYLIHPKARRVAREIRAALGLEVRYLSPFEERFRL